MYENESPPLHREILRKDGKDVGLSTCKNEYEESGKMTKGH
jgi:hypothetical protein